MKNNHLGTIIITALSAMAVGLAIGGPRFLQERERLEKLSTINEQIHNVHLAAKGIVESEEEIEIGNQVTGIIAEVRVDEGDAVHKGQLLVILDSHKIETRINLSKAQLKEAVARLKELEAGCRDEDIETAQCRVKRTEIIYEKAKDEYGRQKRLCQREATTQADLEKAEKMMRLAAEELKEAQVHLKKLRKGARIEEIEQAGSAVESASFEVDYSLALLKDYAIYSPIDGLVSELYQDAGETAHAGSPLLKLINPNKLRIRAELEETDVGKVREGQRVEVSTDAYKSKTYHGKVCKVLPVLKRYSLKSFDPSAAYDMNAQDIYLKLDDFSGLKKGMLVTVRFLK